MSNFFFDDSEGFFHVSESSCNISSHVTVLWIQKVKEVDVNVY